MRKKYVYTNTELLFIVNEVLAWRSALVKLKRNSLAKKLTKRIDNMLDLKRFEDCPKIE